MKSSIKLRTVLLVAVLTAVSCSTTKRLSGDQTLYTGVRKIEIAMKDSSKVSSGVESIVKDPLNVKPNNPLFSPYVRTPIPVGLWIWNSLYTEKKSGVRAWLYRRLGKQPVLMGQVKPDARVGLVVDMLDNNGYFGSSGSYEILPQRNPRKARVSYSFEVGDPWCYGNVYFPEPKCDVTRQILSLKASSGIKSGAQYNVDSLTNERVRITNHLRERSYYYFRPEYLEYLADTTRQSRRVDLMMVLASGIPDAARKAYRIGTIDISLMSADGKGEMDSVEYDGWRLQYQKPLKIRPKILERSLRVRPGDPSRVSAINRTLNNLTRLGIFRFVNMEVTPLDSLDGRDSMDLKIVAAFDAPIQAEFEADFSSKSNSFIGPGLLFDVKHKNIFGGGEVLSVRTNASYEWQTGNSRSSANATAVNSYEFGLHASLVFPRVVPQFVHVGRRFGGKTSINLGGSIINRPKFFNMLSLDLSAAYDFQTSRQSTHNWTPFKLTYNDLLRTTADFDQTMAENPAIAMSFENQFIPSMSYTYTLDRRFDSGRSRIIWQSTVSQAGNLLYCIYGLLGDKGEKQIFGRRFSQFAKATSELKYYYNISDKVSVATRLFAGAGYAYGNSAVLPYTEQFYIGGANSIRAFTVRSLGPGSYRPDSEDSYGYFDQTGDFKLELNAELRFKIIAGLNGAVFIDAGNIFLLKDDPDRPGGGIASGGFLRKIATGTGAGLRYDLSFLVVRADLGIGLHLPYDTGKRGYYNIPNFKDGLGFHLAIGWPF